MARGTNNRSAASTIGPKINKTDTSHMLCAGEKSDSALLHHGAPRGEFPPLATKSITGASAIPQLLQYFVVSAICTPHFGQNISKAPGLIRVTQTVWPALPLSESSI